MKLIGIKITTLVLFIVALMISVVYYFPKTTITIGTYRDLEYSTLFFLQRLELELKKNGLTLNIKVQDENKELDIISFLVNDPQVDFVMHGNFGEKLNKTNEIQSLGIVSRSPILFLKNPKSPVARKITNIGDVGGAKLVVYSRPISNSYVSQAPFWESVTGDVANPHTSFVVLDWLLPSMPNDAIPNDNSLKENHLKLFWPNIQKIYESEKPKYELAFPDEWDFLIVLDPIEERLLTDLLITKQAEFFEFSDIDSTVQRNKFLKIFPYAKATYSKTIPSPWLDGLQIPEQDVKLVTYTNSVSIKSSVDSSLVELLTDAIEKASRDNIYLDKHRGIGFLSNEISEFPKFSSEDTFRPHPVSKSFYREGYGILSETFTPMVASILKKISLIFIPLFTFLYPFFSFVPKLYENHIKNKIYLWYKKLEVTESKLIQLHSSQELITKELAVLEYELREIKIPFFHSDYIQDLYIAREHLILISRKLKG